jgi:DNA-directed RNA polymerase subunit F
MTTSLYRHLSSRIKEELMQLTPKHVRQILDKIADDHPEEKENVRHLKEYIEDLQDRLFTYEELLAGRQGWTLD